MKTRPVVVIAKHKHNAQLVTIVPLPTMLPKPGGPFLHRLQENPLPDKPKDLLTWAKWDMVVTVSLARLDQYKVAKREYVVSGVSTEELLHRGTSPNAAKIRLWESKSISLLGLG